MNVFRKKGIKRIKIKGNWFVIKRLTPLDFLESGEGLPFTLFKEDKGVIKPPEKETDAKKLKDYEDKLSLMKKICMAGVLVMEPPVFVLERPDLLTDKEKVISLFFEADTMQIGIKLYEKILSESLSVFVRLYTIKRNTLVYYGEMSQKFSKTPIDCLLPNGGYTDCDAYLFNSFVLNVMIEEQNKLIKKQNALLKQRRGRK